MAGTLHDIVVQAAVLYRDKKAVCFQPYNKNPIYCTYQDMLQGAEELTLFLKSHNLENKTIGLYCHPNIHLPSWILGILRAPAAYSPVDPGAPSSFTSSLMQRCKIQHVLVEKDKVEMFKLLPGWTEKESSTVQHLHVTLFEAVTSEIRVEAEANNEVDPHIPGDRDYTKSLQNEEHIDIRDRQCLAYVLHTSGTTGTPKIVSVPHCCIVPNILHLRSIFDVSPNDVVLLSSPLTFDPSVIEIFMALSTGACLLVLPDPLKMMPPRLCDLLFHQHKVTVLQVTPTFLKRFGTHSIWSCVLSKETSLRLLALGGEQFPPLSVLKSWRQPGNKTRIFSLYGVTEVSSWATYFEVPETMLNFPSGDSVPLGSPLHGTMVEVRNDDDVRVEEGEGQVFLGGKQRVCFLDGELVLPCGKMRGTGDWVKLQDGNMFYLGRKDNQIKRHGKRLNTEYVQQVVERLEPVESCAVMWFKAKQLLVIFVVPKRPLEIKSLWRLMQSDLLSYALPDDLVLVDSLPHTKHGKIDLSRLKLIYADHLRQKMDSQLPHVDDLWHGLQDLWKSALGLPEGCSDISEDSVFLLSGGDSLKAIRFHEEVEAFVGRSVPGLLEAILSDTLLDVHRLILKHTSPVMEKLQNHTSVNATENHGNPSVDVRREEYPTKRKAEAQRLQMDSTPFVSLSRGNRLFINVCSEQVGRQCEVAHGISPDLVGFSEFSNSGAKRTKPTASSELEITLQERWASDTDKCVDASPLLVISTNKESTRTVYIGSHSHRVQALDLDTGVVVWERILGDRVESSAAVSKCGNFILVGCYDGGIYIMRRTSGENHWIFTTGNAVKSSPVIDPVSGLAFVGSHDQYFYALDVEVKQCVWKAHCDGGAVFSSPCISTEPHHLYVATLGGRVLAFNPVTGKTIWKIELGKPIFSSPSCNQNHVFVGCVDANFYCFSHMGEKLWRLTTDGPIFSSPCISTLARHVTFGSHDGFIYCCSAEGELLWRYRTSSPVYATPLTFPNPHTGNTELLAVPSTDGKLWILDAHSGLLILQHALDGEIFSSPVVYGSRLVVGCRNNLVYCFDLIVNVK
ncbi:beta-alanine-activating enzyme isoform X1 [Bufo bufo]|uniref:beta-alanine-activating enzyme isoform X1 n=3 Tax=Bufo bufo TaxID=8384 RepID=UPI001ABEC7AE|nr:beta-alanine-activating enzyme isoform X1 [Bufo bufo]XP_040274755.1 beta-alanine-activating enzyme isoform X1 [Bufo bufo]